MRKRRFAGAREAVQRAQAAPPPSPSAPVPARRPERASAAAPLPPEAALRRAARLGHSPSGLQALSAAPAPLPGRRVQRYVSRQDMLRAGGLPLRSRVSEDMNLVITGPQ